MSQQFTLCSATAFLLLTGMAASDVAAQTPPETITLSGTVRDLKEQTADGGHPDFERQPDHGFAHYAGSVAYFIGDGRKPVFSGGGYKVLEQWRDSAGNPIAPHLYNKQFVQASGESPNQTQVILKDSSGVDAFEITWLSTTFNGDGTSSWVYRVRELESGKDLSHWNLALAPDQTVAEGTTPGYELGVDGSTGFYGIKWDVTGSFHMGEFTIVLDGHYFGADLQCSVLAKGGREPDVGNLFAPTDVESDTGSPFSTEAMLVSFPGAGDTAGEGGPADNGGVQSGYTFRQWWRDQPGVNLSKNVEIDLQLQPDGTYVFDSATDPLYSSRGGFFPIDEELFGNSEGSEHNYHFTYEVHAEFTYDQDGDQFFQFIGDDDVWLFIDGKLAIDLGGVHTMQEQYADMDRFGLVDGETYSVDFFFAERHRTQSNMKITTNMPLVNVEMPTISAVFD